MFNPFQKMLWSYSGVQLVTFFKSSIPEQVIFAYEEAIGFCIGDIVKDKDRERLSQSSKGNPPCVFKTVFADVQHVLCLARKL